MGYDILEILSYVVVMITAMTMIFGVYAYKLYKLRERQRESLVVSNIDETINESEEYLYFEKKEIKW
jgi:hypothetical protein